MPSVGVARADAPGRAGAVVGAVGRHPDVDDGEVRTRRRDRGLDARRRRPPRRRPRGRRPPAAAPALAGTATESSPITMRTAAPPRPACRARRRCAPTARHPRAATRSASPASPSRARTSRAAAAVVADRTVQPARRARATRSAIGVGVGVLDRVGHGLAGHVVGGGGDVVGQRLGAHVQLDRAAGRCVARRRSAGPSPSSRLLGRSPCAIRAQLGDGGGELGDGLVEQPVDVDRAVAAGAAGRAAAPCPARPAAAGRRRAGRAPAGGAPA